MPALFPSDWLADAPYEDRDLGVLKAGKESEVYLVSRTGPTRTCLMAEKRFKPRLQRAFRNDYVYAGIWGEGTRHEDRAMKKRTRFGQEHLQARWEAQEWTTLQRLHAAGVTVPPPVERVENGYRMAFIGDGDRAAPRLSDVDLDLVTARRVWRELQRDIQRILNAELVHGDLSAFNVLWWHERPVIIDFSQAVDAVVHPAARDLLRRDVERTAGYFRRQGVAVDLDAALALVGDSPARFAHQVLSS
ncbi:MAG: serine/threonine protein kinase [Chloroflexi bacterium]|nr:MAG: serine/threonine protein kinase [Chloroflexota bacterium]